MDESDERDTKIMPEQLAAITKELSERELGVEIGKNFSESIQPWLHSIAKTTAAMMALVTRAQESWEEGIKLFAEAMQRTRDALKRAELLAELGWTLPMHMSLPEFHALVMQDGLTVNRVDEWFQEHYTRDDGVEFNTLRNFLLSSNELTFWKPLVEQVFRAFDRGEYAICVPSLLLVFEGSLARPWEIAFQNKKKRKGFFERKIKGAIAGSIHHYIWKSVGHFCDIVFETAVSDGREHPVLKRNLILHGKSDPSKWDQADCLRLFQAISTVLSIGHEISTASRERSAR